MKRSEFSITEAFLKNAQDSRDKEATAVNAEIERRAEATTDNAVDHLTLPEEICVYRHVIAVLLSEKGTADGSTPKQDEEKEGTTKSAVAAQAGEPALVSKISTEPVPGLARTTSFFRHNNSQRSK